MTLMFVYIHREYVYCISSHESRYQQNKLAEAYAIPKPVPYVSMDLHTIHSLRMVVESRQILNHIKLTGVLSCRTTSHSGVSLLLGWFETMQKK